MNFITLMHEDLMQWEMLFVFFFASPTENRPVHSDVQILINILIVWSMSYGFKHYANIMC